MVESSEVSASMEGMGNPQSPYSLGLSASQLLLTTDMFLLHFIPVGTNAHSDTYFRITVLCIPMSVIYLMLNLYLSSELKVCLYFLCLP